MHWVQWHSLAPLYGRLSNVRRFLVTRADSLDLESITGQRILLPRIDLTPLDSTLPFSFTRRKFTIRIDFAMTINKAQGQTLDKVGLYLSQPVFSHGYFYVAMSRVRSFEKLTIQILPNNKKDTINIFSSLKNFPVT
ncbi:ATP-dependent DNA helicase PIF1-like [Aphis craccivora]|uniref:ATP-dependent DNA helicase PIF1-like n=1 Tax=Aphis craccivora TaxID=307492 RepID=A0A6G0Y232_APHCR|nr:ATP-dependent DNA helicase PIF1-like [Aphis craccivora]